MIAPFRLTDDALDLADARAFSSSLGLTAKGRIDRTAEQIDVQGTIVPAYFFNSLLGNIPLGIWEIGITAGLLGIWGFCYLSFMDAFPRVRVLLMTSPYRDEVQVPVNPRTMEPLPAHE